MRIFNETAIPCCAQIAAVATLTLACASAQQQLPAITFAKTQSTEALAATGGPSREAGASAEAKANYREFSTSKVSQTSEPELFKLEFHSATTLTSVSATQDFHVSGGTCIEGHAYVAGDVCNVDVVFRPQGPGHRTGKLSVVHSASATPLLAPLGGTGYGPAVSFIPSQMATVPGTLTGSGSTAQGNLLSPGGLAIDGGDSLYIADTGHNLIKFRDSSGTITSIIGGGTASAVGYSGFGSGIKLNDPKGVAVDNSGDIFIADTDDNLVLVRLIDGVVNTQIGGGSIISGCTLAGPCRPSDVNLQPPYSVATDPSGNVYTTPKEGGEYPGFYIGENEVDNKSSVYYLLDTPSYNYYTTSPSIAVDTNSNLYYTYEDPGGPLLSPTPLCYILAQNRAYSTGATGETFWIIGGSGPCGFSGDGGKATGAEISTSIGEFAFDAAGNFYFADTGNNRIRRVDAATGVIRTIAGSGSKGFSGDGGPSTSASIQAPVGLAVDSNGLVYSTGLATSSSGSPEATDLRTFGTTGQLNFGTQAAGVPSAAHTIVLSNVGNDTLNFTHVAISSGTTSDYAIDPNSTSCNFSLPLDSGHSCLIGFIFTPKAVGARNAVVTLLDDTVGGTQTINLTGNGATTATLTPASLPFGAGLVGKATSAQTVVLKNTGSASLTITGIAIQGSGAAAFSETTTCGATLAAGVSCNISVVFKPAATGPFAASLVVSDNGVSSQQIAALTGTGTAAAVVSLSSTTLAFGNETEGTASGSKSVTLTNTGGLPLSITSITVTGADASSFVFANTCGTSLAAGANCSIHGHFGPTTTGAMTAAITISDNASNSPQTVSLSGTGTARVSVPGPVHLLPGPPIKVVEP